MYRCVTTPDIDSLTDLEAGGALPLHDLAEFRQRVPALTDRSHGRTIQGYTT